MRSADIRLHNPQPHAEDFLSTQSAQDIVGIVMAERVDEAGRLLPIKDQQHAIGRGGFQPYGDPIIRTDVVLPPYRNKWRPAPGVDKVLSDYDFLTEDILYNGLAGLMKTSLNAEEIQRVAEDTRHLEQAVRSSDRYTSYVNDTQLRDSVRIKSKVPQQLKGLQESMRTYVAGGINGMSIAARAIEAGAEFGYAKIWKPQAAYGEQMISTMDGAIFITHTLSDLQSTIGALRHIGVEDVIEDEQIVGMPVPNLPGVMIAQSGAESFNGQVSTFFAQHLITAANSPDFALRAGDMVDDNWVAAVAARMRDNAIGNAAVLGAHQQSHAIRAEQNIDILKTIIR